MAIRPVNMLDWLTQVTVFGRMIVIARTKRSDPPQLFTSCDPFTPAAKNRMLGGQPVPHGNKAWYQKPPDAHDPTYSDGITHMWDIPAPCVGAPACEFFIAELGTPPIMDWSSMIHQCAGAGGAGSGVYYDTGPETIVPAGWQPGVDGPDGGGIRFADGVAGPIAFQTSVGGATSSDFWKRDKKLGTVVRTQNNTAERSGVFVGQVNGPIYPAGGGAGIVYASSGLCFAFWGPELPP